jgi:hypothetical protein
MPLRHRDAEAGFVAMLLTTRKPLSYDRGFLVLSLRLSCVFHSPVRMAQDTPRTMRLVLSVNDFATA